MKTKGSSPPLNAAQRGLLAKLWRDDPHATREAVAARASALLGRKVTVDQVRSLRRSGLVASGPNMPRHVPRPADRPRPSLPYSSPLADLILEARAVRRRLGLGRAREEVAA